MKNHKILFTVIILLASISLNMAKNNTAFFVVNSDSVNLLTEFSLFYEAYKNKDYEFACEHGWIVINTDPSKYIKFKPFKKMEDILWNFHDSVATTDEEKLMYADTLLYLYDKAVELNAKNPEYFILKKAFVLETWKDVPVEEVIAAYEYAFEKDPNADTYYKDRLGFIYSQNANDENDYKMKALDLYSALSEAEPENEVWISRIDGLAENIDELVDIRKKAWDLDKENIEKAYNYTETCIKATSFDKAIEPLLFLVGKAPEVINYWRKLATVYRNLENKDEEINAYKTLIELEPNNRENYFNIAIVYQKLGQLSVCRSYLQKSNSVSEEKWGRPIYFEAQLYEQAARECGFEFDDKCVYQLAVDTYKKAAAISGPQASAAKERVKALVNSVPQSEDYFFRKFKAGDVIKIEGKCYGWINRSIVVP